MKTKKMLTMFVFFFAIILAGKAQITVDNDIKCNGDATGQLTVAPGFGTGPYTYLWSNGDITPTTMNLSSGTYFVTVTDVFLVSMVYSATLTNPPLLTVSTVSTNVSCTGGNNGTAIATGSGGTPVLTYAWSTGAITPNVINLTAGTYTVTVTDANGCTATDNVVITEPPLPITVIASKTDVLCTGSSTGSASVLAFGGTGTLDYLWSTGGITSSISNVVAGNYQVTVTDDNGCIAISTIVIVEPAFAVSVSTVSTDVSCFGGNNGTITATGSGGVPSLNYLWNTSEITPTISNLTAGTYTVTVTDANGCTVSTSVIITQPLLPLSVVITSTNINCFGYADGTATATASGGSFPYTYLWSNGGTTTTIINLSAGTYFVTVTDGNACTTTISVLITEPSTPIHVHTTVLSNVTCNGGNDGAVSATGSGGTGGLTYAWSTGSLLQTITALPMGVYTVTVTDLNGCTTTASVAVSEPTPITMVPTITSSSCDGHNDGAISIITSGGTGPLSYVWNEINFDSTYVTQNLVGIRGGIYALTITDSVGCTFVDTLIVPTLVTVPFTFTLVPYVCNGATGAVTVQATNAAPGVYFTYSWSSLYNTGSFTSNDSVFNASTSFVAGSYTITVTDNATGCASYFDFTINQSATPLVVTPIVQHNVCYADMNGSITLQVFGGNPMPGYHVTWTGPNGFVSSVFTISGLAVGDYTYVVTDDSVCSTTGTIRIEPLNPILGYITSENVICNATATGHAEAFYSGGTGALNYLWSNGATTPFISGVNIGTYTLTVTDSVGCSITSSALITQPAPILVTLDSLQNIQCNGGNDGGIWLTTSGGNGPLMYTWLLDGNLFPEVTEDIINVPAGVYQVTVMDSLQCFTITTYTLTQPAPTTFIDSVHVISCNNGSDGYWQIQPVGPNFPYVAIFSTGDTISTDTIPTPSIGGLSAGSYSVTITSSIGCTWNYTLLLEQPLPLTVGTVNIVPIICKGDSTGSVTMDVVYGGTGPYTFIWSNGMTSNPITNIPDGMYNVTITDALGCVMYETYEVEEPYEWIKFFPTITSTSCQQSSDGQVVVNTEDIYWSPFSNAIFLYDSLGVLVDSVQPGQTIGNLSSGPYEAILINQYGCTARDSLYVDQGPGDCILIPNLVTANGDGFNDVFSVQGGCEYQTFLVKIFTDQGEQVFESVDCNFIWDPLTNQAAANSVYYYYIEVTENAKVYKFKSSINITR